MLIGGFQKTSLIDYPGKISAVIFTAACNFKCGYCHNPALVGLKTGAAFIPQEVILPFLEKRKGKLDAVVFTGGEPTLQLDLPWFFDAIKRMGYSIKLDTNGSRPKMLRKLIKQKLVDYFAMDVKAPLSRYQEITKSRIDPAALQESIEIIMDSGVDYEFRTTVVKDQLGEKDLAAIGPLIRGAKRYFLQRFVPARTLDPLFKGRETFSDDVFERLKTKMEAFVQSCAIR